MNKKILIYVFVLISGLLSKTLAQIPNNETGFRNYFQQNKDSLDQIEGIWRTNSSQEFYHHDTLYDVDNSAPSSQIAIIKKDQQFESYSLQGKPYDVRFYPTEVAGVYLYKNYFPETKEYSKANAVISKGGEMEYSYEIPDLFLQKTLGKSYEPGTRVLNKSTWKKIFPARKK